MLKLLQQLLSDPAGWGVLATLLVLLGLALRWSVRVYTRWSDERTARAVYQQQRPPRRIATRQRAKRQPAAPISVGEIAERALDLAARRKERIAELEAANAELEAVNAGLEAEITQLRTEAVPQPNSEPTERTETWNWLHALTESLHLLIIGHSRGGKTTLIHEIATRRAAAGEPVYVCDPDAAPGMWPRCRVAGHGNDFAAINTMLETVGQELEQRRQQRGAGNQRSFPPVHLVIEEYADVVRECPAARSIIEDGLRRWGKLNGHLIVGVQDKQVKTLGFEGQGDLRCNFAYIAEVQKTSTGQRQLMLSTGSGEKIGTYPVPLLTDPESLIRPKSEDAMLLQLLTQLERTAAGVERSTPEGTTEELRSEAVERAEMTDEERSDLTISEVERAIIAMELKSGTALGVIAKRLPGYSGRKYRNYLMKVEQVKAEIDAAAIQIVQAA